MWSLRSSGHTNSLLLGKDDGCVLFREHTVVLVRLGEWPFHHFSGVWGAAVLPTETCHGSPLVHFQDHKWSLGCCKVQNNLSLPPHCSLPDVCSPSSVSDSRLSSSSRRLSRRGLRIKGVSSSFEPCHDDKVENPPRFFCASSWGFLAERECEMPSPSPTVSHEPQWQFLCQPKSGERWRCCGTLLWSPCSGGLGPWCAMLQLQSLTWSGWLWPLTPHTPPTHPLHFRPFFPARRQQSWRKML